MNHAKTSSGVNGFSKKQAPDSKIRSSSCNWASRIRTYKMTESESAALPFGYSPLFEAVSICRLRIEIIVHQSGKSKHFFKNILSGFYHRVLSGVRQRRSKGSARSLSPFAGQNAESLSPDSRAVSLPPCIGVEQQEHGIEFQPAGQHVKHEDILGNK